MRRGKKMIVLLGLLCVLLGGYVWLGGQEQEDGVSEQEGVFPLWQEDADVASLSWTQDGETFTFIKGENVWQRQGDADFPVNQTALANLADTIAGLSATTELTDVSQPADYGLDEPAFSVSAADADGQTVTFDMGDATPFEDGYYVRVTGRDAVYVIEESLADAFDKSLAQLATMEEMPAVLQATRLTVGDTLDVTYDEEMDAWRDTATGEALDGDAVKSLVSVATDLAWSELITTDATDEELAEWKLDDAQAVAVTLYSGDVAERTVLLGDKNAETDRYARLPDSRMVYTFYADDADDLLEASIDTLWQKQPVTMTAEELGEAAFTWEGGQAVLTAADSESTTAQSVMEQLGAIEGTARVALEEPGETVLTVQLTDGEGVAQTLSFHAYDVDSYLLPITDAHGMLVPAQDVDKLIRMLKQLG